MQKWLTEQNSCVDEMFMCSWNGITWLMNDEMNKKNVTGINYVTWHIKQFQRTTYHFLTSSRPISTAQC